MCTNKHPNICLPIAACCQWAVKPKEKQAAEICLSSFMSSGETAAIKTLFVLNCPPLSISVPENLQEQRGLFIQHKQSQFKVPSTERMFLIIAAQKTSESPRV